MISQWTRYTVLLGITGSLVIPQTAFAQIPVTGGRMTGDAGFFVPNTGNTILFDAGIRTLRLETPNGVTIDSRLTPTFSTLDPIGNRVPGFGDSGTLSGVLSGRAFDLFGNPFFFSNVPTTIGFTLNSFISDSVFRGTVITPISPNASASTTVVFLPVEGVILNPASSSNFSASLGKLYIGAFDANLSNGFINLPPDVRFGIPIGTEFDVPDIVVRSINPITFKLSGSGTANPDSYFDPNFTNSLRYRTYFDRWLFADFNIQIEGTSLSITGRGWQTFIEISNIGSVSTNTNDVDFFQGSPIVDFNIIGRGTGTIFDNSQWYRSGNRNYNGVRFVGNTQTSFDFRDRVGNFITGQGNLTDFLFVTVSRVISSFSSSPGLTPPTSNTINLTSLGVNLAAAPVIPPPNLLVGFSDFPADESDVFVNSSDSEKLILDSSVFSSTNSVNDYCLTNSEIPHIQVLDNGEKIIVTCEGIQAVYQPVGLPSRVFPGFRGWEQASLNSVRDESLSEINSLLGEAFNIVSGKQSPQTTGGRDSDVDALIDQAYHEVHATRTQVSNDANVASSDQVLSKLLTGGNLTDTDLSNLTPAIHQLALDTQQLVTQTEQLGERKVQVISQFPIEQEMEIFKEQNRRLRLNIESQIIQQDVMNDINIYELSRQRRQISNGVELTNWRTGNVTSNTKILLKNDE